MCMVFCQLRVCHAYEFEHTRCQAGENCIHIFSPSLPHPLPTIWFQIIRFTSECCGVCMFRGHVLCTSPACFQLLCTCMYGVHDLGSCTHVYLQRSLTVCMCSSKVTLHAVYVYDSHPLDYAVSCNIRPLPPSPIPHPPPHTYTFLFQTSYNTHKCRIQNKMQQFDSVSV